MDKTELKVIGEAPAEIHVNEKHGDILKKILSGEVKTRFYISEGKLRVEVLTEEE